MATVRHVLAKMKPRLTREEYVNVRGRHFLILFTQPTKPMYTTIGMRTGAMFPTTFVSHRATTMKIDNSTAHIKPVLNSKDQANVAPPRTGRGGSPPP